MLQFDAQKCLVEVRQADTADLLDRATAYWRGLEPEALALIAAELGRRGVDAAQIESRRTQYERDCLFDGSGVAFRCSRCARPAVAVSAGWHRLFGMLPLFPRSMRYCREHRP